MKKFYNLEARSSFRNLVLSLHNYFLKESDKNFYLTSVCKRKEKKKL